MNRLSATAMFKILTFVLVCSATVAAQISTTRLEGVIHITSKTTVSGATVTATHDTTGIKVRVQSDATGRYVFPALPPGSYTVLVEAKGARPVAHTNVLLGAYSSIEEDFFLSPGSATEPVTEEAPGDRLKSMESEVSAVFLRRELEVLPQLDRSPVALSVLQPGVQILGGNSEFSRVNGTQQGSNNITLDGVDANDAIDPRLGLSMIANNPDSIEQFRVVTNAGQAEFGRNAGAQVMLITRSGGSRWSGNAFDYFRNKDLNANDFFNNSANIPKPLYTQNLFGASLGGPLVKDRTFLFGNYQGRRTTREISRNRTVLTPVAKTGAFQWISPLSSTTNSFDIAANDPRKLGIDPQIAEILSKLPDPNNTDVGDGLNTAGYRFNNPIDSREDQLTLRADHKLTDNHRLFLRSSWERINAIDFLSGTDASFPGQPAGRDIETHWGFSLGSDWSISPRMVNQIRLGYQNARISLTRPARVAGPMLLANSWTNLQDPSFALSHNSPVAQFTDNLTLIRGKHALKAGLIFSQTNQKSRNDAGIYPNVSFGQGDGNTPPSSVGPPLGVISLSDRQTFENLYNDLLGRMEQVTQTFNGNLEAFFNTGTARTRNFVFRDYGAFLQDDWKLLPNLTVNLGVRYELNGVPSEENGILGALDRAKDISAGANIADFTIQKGAAWHKKDSTDFAPRAGFAWMPRGSTKMVLRGGYGFFYDRLIGAISNFVDTNTPASSQAVSVFPNLAETDLRLRDGIPALSPGAPVLALPPSRSTPVALLKADLRTPNVQHFNLTLERDLFRNIIVQVGYVGERGKRLFTSLNLNQPKIQGDFLQAFKEIQSFRSFGTPVSSSNTLVRIFGTPNAAITAIGGSAVDQGLAGSAADTVDRGYFGNYAAAGISDFYLRNFPQFSQFIVGTNDGKSSYDSLQVSVRKTAGPLRAYGNYTWSKALDNVPTGCAGCSVLLDSFNPQSSKAPGDTDRPRVVNAWVVYTLPIGRAQPFAADAPAWLNSIIGNWEMGLITIWETGSRFSVSSGRRTSTDGVDSLADYSGNHQIGAVLKQTNGVFWFTPDQIKAFSFPVAGATGTSGRNAFTGPDYFELDMSLVKSFRVGGERRLSLRGEVYNILNRTNFGVPGTNLNDAATFGRFGSTQGFPRLIQVAMRFDF